LGGIGNGDYLIMARLIPEVISRIIETAEKDVHADNHHHLSYKRRKEIYDAFLESSDDVAGKAMRWLAVITAQKVLPLFQKEYPDDALPEELITTAISILHGEGNETTVDDIQEQGYLASGASWGYDEEEISWNADLAGRSAYHALMEARGLKPLENMDMIYEIGVVGMPSGKWIEKFPEPKGADQFTDENLCEFPNCDTAGIAAVAFSCQPGGPVCDKSKLKQYWIWWLTEAIPKAWEIAAK
jgi:hypothetical protein